MSLRNSFEPLLLAKPDQFNSSSTGQLHASPVKVISDVSTLDSTSPNPVQNNRILNSEFKQIQVGKDQENAQSEKRLPLQKPRSEKTKLTIRYLYHENIS